jgi:putative transposase
MVRHPREYPWSSYCWHAEGHHDSLVIDHGIYLALGNTDSERQAAYRALFKSHIGETTLGEIRETLNKGWVLGSEQFKDDVATLVQRRVRPLPKGRRERRNGVRLDIFT